MQDFHLFCSALSHRESTPLHSDQQLHCLTAFLGFKPHVFILLFRPLWYEFFLSLTWDLRTFSALKKTQMAIQPLYSFCFLCDIYLTLFSMSSFPFSKMDFSCFTGCFQIQLYVLSCFRIFKINCSVIFSPASYFKSWWFQIIFLNWLYFFLYLPFILENVAT